MINFAAVFVFQNESKRLIDIMRIESINPELLAEIPFFNAGKGPGRAYVDLLPIHEALVDALPAGVSAIIATADLQGRESVGNDDGSAPRLLGEVLPSLLQQIVLPDLALPAGASGGRLLHRSRA